MATLKTASVLSFEKKLANSDALMFAGNWADISNDNWQPIAVTEKDVRGTISNRLKAALKSDPAKLDAEIQKANLQKVDVAALPFDTDTLKVSFTLRVLGDLATPSVCNSPEYQSALSDKINGYIAEHSLSELSIRYANNIANARFLWRNRVGVESIEVRVSHIVDQKEKASFKFSSLDFSLREMNTTDSQLNELSKLIEDGLANDNYVFLKIDAYALVGKGQEVFPSQELVLDKNNNSRKSKFLYTVNDTAAMHSQKIGNALRTIDTWYSEADTIGPISVEPFGSVTSRGVAYRQPSPKPGMDFYSLLDNWVLKDKAPDVEQQHYVIATIVRGGVFGEKSE